MHQIPDHLAITKLSEVKDELVPKKMEMRKRSREEAAALTRKQHIVDMLDKVREVLLRPPNLCATEQGTKKFSTLGQKQHLGLNAIYFFSFKNYFGYHFVTEY